MEFTSENLEQAVTQFYHTDASMQAQAHQWLTSAQTSPNAWSFVWELLQPCKVTSIFVWCFNKLIFIASHKSVGCYKSIACPFGCRPSLLCSLGLPVLWELSFGTNNWHHQ